MYLEGVWWWLPVHDALRQGDSAWCCSHEALGLHYDGGIGGRDALRGLHGGQGLGDGARHGLCEGPCEHELCRLHVLLLQQS